MQAPDVYKGKDSIREPLRDVRGLHLLERLESCQVVHRGGIRRSCVRGRCGWSQRSATGTIRRGSNQRGGQPRLQYGAGVWNFFVRHRGWRFDSTALMAPMTQNYVAEVDHYVDAHQLARERFDTGQRKDEVTQKYLAAMTAARACCTWESRRSGPRCGPRPGGATRSPTRPTPG